jgi:hypothetical protein
MEKKKFKHILSSKTVSIKGLKPEYWIKVRLEAFKKGETTGSILTKALKHFISNKNLPLRNIEVKNPKRVITEVEKGTWKKVKELSIGKDLKIGKIVNNAIKIHFKKFKRID